MIKPVCTVCGYIVLDGTVPDVCPVCHAKSSAFSEQENALMIPKDSLALTDAEKKHTPHIVVAKESELISEECMDVRVRIGIDILHPMTKEHLITWLDYYIDDVFCGRISFSQVLYPESSLCIPANTGKKITVVSQCNVHGAWKNEADLV